jgi:hypothetical protein
MRSSVWVFIAAGIFAWVPLTPGQTALRTTLKYQPDFVQNETSVSVPAQKLR